MITDSDIMSQLGASDDCELCRDRGIFPENPATRKYEVEPSTFGQLTITNYIVCDDCATNVVEANDWLPLIKRVVNRETRPGQEGDPTDTDLTLHQHSVLSAAGLLLIYALNTKKGGHEGPVSDEC